MYVWVCFIHFINSIRIWKIFSPKQLAEIGKYGLRDAFIKSIKTNRLDDVSVTFYFHT